MVRALAIGDLDLKDWFKAVSKETFVGLILGAAMAVIAAVVSKLYGRLPDCDYRWAEYDSHCFRGQRLRRTFAIHS